MLKKENISKIIEVGASSVHIYMDEDSILHIIAKGDMDKKIALQLREAVLAIFSTQTTPVNELVDLNEVGKNSPEARDIWKEMGEMPQTGKVALIGMHSVARVLAAFVTTRIVGNKNMKFFKFREEAMQWLKS